MEADTPDRGVTAPVRVIVCGGRDYSNLERVRTEILQLAADWGQHHLLIVHGAARGADQLAGWIADGLGVATEEHPAQWDDLGRRAGMVRNEQMAQAGAELCVAFPGGRGTADMVERARKRGIPVREIDDVDEWGSGPYGF